MKSNLYLVTVKTSGTHYLHIKGSTITDAIAKVSDYLEQTKTPGVGYTIVEVKFVGTIVEPDYSLAG